MRAVKNIAYFILLLNFCNCEKRAIPPDSNQPHIPSNFIVSGGFRSITMYWTPSKNKDIEGYKIYYGKISKNYSDTLLVGSEISKKKIKDLEDDQKYFCAISAVDINNNESYLSEELSVQTYLAFEDFSQPDGALDTSKWYYNVGYEVTVINSQVATIQSLFNDVSIRRSFGQYLSVTPLNKFIVECEFKLGTPNVGGAGLMIRSKKANPEMYYKGYNAFIFWNFNNWELRLEESLVDRLAMVNVSPIKLPEIRPDEWIKLSVMYNDYSIQASVYRLLNYSILGTIAANDQKEGTRPSDSDCYCGFFTTQYGGNIIYTDNFGIKRAD